jgi:hypothetical protein
LKNEFKFISYIEDKDKNVIYIWIYDEEKKLPINILIPWTKNDSEKLRNASKSRANGKTVKGTFRNKGLGVDHDSGSLNDMREFALNEILKKSSD